MNKQKYADGGRRNLSLLFSTVHLLFSRKVSKLRYTDVTSVMSRYFEAYEEYLTQMRTIFLAHIISESNSHI